MSFWRKSEEENPWVENYDNWADSGSKKEQDFDAGTDEWYPLNSSNVDAVMWDKRKKRLLVKFKGGSGVYWYADPNQKHYVNIMSSASPGRYIWNLRTNGVTYGKQ